jgi:hypothetical protein
MSEADSKYRGSKEYVLVYAELVTAARYRGTLTYPDVGRAMGLKTFTGNHFSRVTGQILGEISEDEVCQGRPMLSAIAVGKGTHKPGDGFFEFARQLGRLKSEDSAAERAFWEAEVKAVYETWAETR